MAVRWTKYGLGSYDPLQAFKKEKEKKKPKPEAAPKPEVAPKPSKLAKPPGPLPAGQLGTRERLELATARAKAGGIAPPTMTPKGEFVYAETAEQKAIEAELQQPELIPTLEKAGAFEEVTPKEVSLAPSGEIPGPVIGPAAGAIFSVLDNAAMKGWLPDLGGEAGLTGEEAFPTPITPETLREASLREIQKESFNEGISFGESFGSFVESIPVVGTLARKWAAGLIETPSANSDNAIGEIRSERERAATGTEKVASGRQDPSYALGQARAMEENIAKLEGRIKLLIQGSAILRANTDEVNKIQEEILRSKERVAQYRQAASIALIAQTTGTGRIIPTDEQMYFDLKEFKEG